MRSILPETLLYVSTLSLDKILVFSLYYIMESERFIGKIAIGIQLEFYPFFFCFLSACNVFENILHSKRCYFLYMCSVGDI